MGELSRGGQPARRADVRPEDLIVAVLLLISAAVTLAEGLPRYSGRQGIGPGAFPTWVALLLAACAVLLLGRALQRGLAPWEHWPRGAALRRVTLASASLALYLLALPVLGFLLASSLLLLYHFRAMGGYSWRAALPMAFGSALLMVLVFKGLLFMPLPGGLVGI